MRWFDLPLCFSRSKLGCGPRNDFDRACTQLVITIPGTFADNPPDMGAMINFVSSHELVHAGTTLLFGLALVLIAGPMQVCRLAALWVSFIVGIIGTGYTIFVIYLCYLYWTEALYPSLKELVY